MSTFSQSYYQGKKGKGKGKAVPLHARRGAEGFQEVKVPRLRDNGPE